MKNQLKEFYETIVFILTPEDSTATPGQGNISVDITSKDLNKGTAKALFWILSTMGLFYVLTLL